jgi:hypothetical protein
MKKRATKGQKHPKGSTVVPPIAVPFEEAVARLVNVKPPEKPARKRRKKP